MQGGPYEPVPQGGGIAAPLLVAPVLLPVVPPPRLVPRSAPEMVDEGVRAVRRDIGLFTSIAAVTVIPANLLSAAVTTLFTPFNPLNPLTYFRVGAHTAITTDTVVTFGITALLALVTTAITALGTGAIVTAAGLRTLDQPCDLGTAYRHARRRYLPLLGATLLSLLLVAGITTFSVFVATPFALYLYIGWQLAPHAVVLEGRRAGGALGRSLALVRGGWWRFAGVQLVLLALQVFALAVPGGLALLVSSFTLSQDLLGGAVGAVLLAVVASLVGVVMQPIALVTATLYYADQRLRREGFDIDLLLQRGAAERAAGAA